MNTWYDAHCCSHGHWIQYTMWMDNNIHWNVCFYYEWKLPTFLLSQQSRVQIIDNCLFPELWEMPLEEHSCRCVAFKLMVKDKFTVRMWGLSGRMRIGRCCIGGRRCCIKLSLLQSACTDDWQWPFVRVLILQRCPQSCFPKHEVQCSSSAECRVWTLATF